MNTIIRLILLFMIFLTSQSGMATTSEFAEHQYDVNHIVLSDEIYGYDTNSNPRDCCQTPFAVNTQDRSFLAFVDDFLATKNATKPLLGKNPTLGKNKNRINTELEGGTATAKSIFRNQTKGQKVTQQPLGPKGGTRRVAEDGTQIRLPNNGSGARVDLPGRGSAGRETIHFTP